ncbi:FkbM family methyltransferase [Actinocorallia longicatena]|uniref:Methyltransferase FkbM domain-containing protein n=1 Tax=Actinocorallia longicatena TaxID=111803 RepID=A0ABP6QIS7_9ACTN
MSQRAARAIAALTPEPLLGAVIRRAYPRIEPELADLGRLVPPGGTALDVGGWFGPWTQRLLRHADRVVTIEADPGLAALLQRTFGDARVISAAASDHTAGATLWRPPGGALAGISSVEHRPEGEAAATPVPTVRIDDLGLDDLRFVKMDIEGHELAALRGAELTIRRDLPVLLLELEARHGTVGPVLDLLDGWGYEGSVAGKPLAEFDLAAHQAARAYQLGRSFPARVLRPGDRYVNSVVFRHPRRCYLWVLCG